MEVQDPDLRNRIEWSSPSVPPEARLELAALQRELLAWRRLWPIETARPLLALHARNQSDRILQIAGYYTFQDADQQAHAPDAATPQ